MRSSRAWLCVWAFVLVALTACHRARPGGIEPRNPVADAEHLAHQAILNEMAIRVDTIPDRSIGVVPFRVAASSDTSLLGSALGFGLADLLRSDLAKSHELQLVDRLRLDAVLRELRLGATGRVDSTTAPRTGRLVGARHLLFGGLAMNGTRLIVTAGVADTKSAAVQSALAASASMDNIFDAEKELALRLFVNMGVNLTPAERVAVEERPTKNLLAFLSYSRGVAFQADTQFSAAVVEFQRAVQLDPQFRMANTRMLEAQQLAALSSARNDGASARRRASLTRATAVTVGRVNGVFSSPLGGSQQPGTAVDPEFPSDLITILITIRPPQ